MSEWIEKKKKKSNRQIQRMKRLIEDENIESEEDRKVKQ